MPDGFERIAIIGLGLIGGSLAAALKQRGLKGSIVAFDNSAAGLAQGLGLGVIDESADSVADCIAGADIAVICVPVLAIPATLDQFVQFPGIITDVGSVKSPVLAAAQSAFGCVPANLVPGHPIAGSEKHGVTAASGDLFVNHKVILTPVDDTSASALQQVRDLWNRVGADVVTMTASHHDDVFAQTSHLPHLLAYALVDMLSQQGDSLEIFEFAAGGFRDFSRIAASDPVMWRDIFSANGAQVVRMLDKYQAELLELRELIATGDLDKLQAIFERAKLARDHFSRLQAANGSE